MFVSMQKNIMHLLSAVSLHFVLYGNVLSDDSEIVFSNQDWAKIRSLALSKDDITTSTKIYNNHVVALGKKLFFDVRLSRNNETSCATCHDPKMAWSSDRVVKNAGGIRRSTPSLINIQTSKWFGWDGRFSSLEKQAEFPLLNPFEMNMTPSDLAAVVINSQDIRSAYVSAFPNDRNSLVPKPTDTAVQSILINITKSIAAFEKTIPANWTKFDEFANGQNGNNVLNKQEALGLKTFIGKGKCIECHSGKNLTDNEFHDILIRPATITDPVDLGRQTGISELLSNSYDLSEEQKLSLPRAENSSFQFKTPSLRASYAKMKFMHDGRFLSLRDVILHYSDIEVALSKSNRADPVLSEVNISKNDIEALLAFLKCFEPKS